MWYTLHNLKRSASGEVSASIEMTQDSPWFSGHFPGEPILPGIAQLGMVFDAIWQSNNESLKISSVSRVRFKQIVRPNDRLEIIAKPMEENSGDYSFRMMVGKELVCSGIVTVEKQGGKQGCRQKPI
jgi:3-hydroxymyristoyl/3-hydroxydecanoyl-(acyl carrier protein) dehydratase